MAKKFFYVCAGLFLLALSYNLGARSATAQVARPSVAGRFQIVNGTPEFASNITLLDTATGDTWLKCTWEDDTSGWCKMRRSDSPPGKLDTTKP